MEAEDDHVYKNTTITENGSKKTTNDEKNQKLKERNKERKAITTKEQQNNNKKLYVFKTAQLEKNKKVTPTTIYKNITRKSLQNARDKRPQSKCDERGRDTHIHTLTNLEMRWKGREGKKERESRVVKEQQ